MSESKPVQPDQTPEVEPASPGRRTLVQVATGLAGLGYLSALGYPVYRYLNAAAKEALEEASVTEVTLDVADLPRNAALMFKFGGKPAMLIRHADDTFIALSAICTHLGCTVAYQPEQDRIHCACHGGVYDPHTGATVSGPPPKALQQFQTALVEGKVVVSRA